jgi:hypothetical protein
MHGLLSNNDFKNAVPKAVLNALHNIRLAGNKAAHERQVHVLINGYSERCILSWVLVYIINGGKQNDCPIISNRKNRLIFTKNQKN